MSQILFSHAAAPLTPGNLWAAWSLQPSVLVSLALTVLLYVWGMRNSSRRASAGRAGDLRRWGFFLGAVVSLLIAFVSPLDALSDVLFSAHMTQHLILIMIAAPLLILSDLPLAVVWALPRRWAQSLGHGLNRAAPLSRLWHLLTSPVSAWLLFAIPFWAWHASVLYEAALRNETVHSLEHLGFLLTSMLFWWVLFRRTTADHIHYGMAVAYLFTTMLQSTILGALMTFTSLPWYPYYARLTAAWGITPLADQQLAGLIMWMPGNLVFTLLTIGYFAAWLRSLERRSARLQPRDDLRARQESR